MACASVSDPLRAIGNMGRGLALIQIEEKPSSSQDGRRVLGQRDAEFFFIFLKRKQKFY